MRQSGDEGPLRIFEVCCKLLQSLQLSSTFYASAWCMRVEGFKLLLLLLLLLLLVMLQLLQLQWTRLQQI